MGVAWYMGYGIKAASSVLCQTKRDQPAQTKGSTSQDQEIKKSGRRGCGGAEPAHRMEGYLIRVPAQVERSTCLRRVSLSQSFRALQQKTQLDTSLRYYVLGEGFLRGFATPEEAQSFGSDATPAVEEYQLTCHHVQVEPIYSLLMFRVSLRAIPMKKVADNSNSREKEQDSTDEVDEEDDGEEQEEDSSSSSEDDAESYLRMRSRSRAAIEQTRALTKSVVFFAATKQLVEQWTKRITHWNRHCFGFGDQELSSEQLEAARKQLVDAFQRRDPELGFADQSEGEAIAIAAPAANGAKEVADAGNPNGLQWWQMGSSMRTRVSIHPSSSVW